MHSTIEKILFELSDDWATEMRCRCKKRRISCGSKSDLHVSQCSRCEALFDLNTKNEIITKINDHKKSRRDVVANCCCSGFPYLLPLPLALTLFNIICLVTAMISRDNINNYVRNLCSGDYLAAFSQFSFYMFVWFTLLCFQQCCDLCM